MASPFPLPISYGKTDAVKNSGGFLINWEAEVAPRDALTPVTLRGSPGLELFSDLGTQPCVGAIEVDGAGYIITKTGLYRVFPDGGSHQFATFSLGVRVSVATNGIHIVATDGQRIWSYAIRTDEQSRYDTSAAYVNFAVELTSDPNYYPAETVTFLDGFLIFGRTGTNQFYNTEQYSLTVLGSAFSQAETNPDDVVAVLQDNQVLNVIGVKTSEFWTDVGVGDSPFQRVQGGTVGHGAASAYSVASNKGNVFMLALEGVVYAHQGYSARPISKPEVEDEIRKRDASSATAYCYDDAGHPYYVLNLDAFGDAPAITLVYDLSTNLWHRRSDATYGRHRASCAMNVFGKVLVGDFSSGKVYRIGPDLYSNDGDPLIAEIITAQVPPFGGEYADYNLFEMEMDAGLGNADCPIPQIGLEVSDDDGKTFGNQRLKDVGAIGEFKTKIRWRRNGSSYWRRYRIVLSDPVRRSATSLAWIE